MGDTYNELAHLRFKNEITSVDLFQYSLIKVTKKSTSYHDNFMK